MLAREYFRTELLVQCPVCGHSEIYADARSAKTIFPCPKGSLRHREMVKNLGGREQFPFLRDPNTGVSMYESSDIVKYLFRQYGGERSPSFGMMESMLVTGWVPTLLRAGRGMTLWEYSTKEPPPGKLELFSYENNPYARIVREALCELELPYILLTVGQGSKRATFLSQMSGSKEVPYLVDPNTGVKFVKLSKFGKFPVIVASSPEMAKQFLRIHDTSFASRPALAAGVISIGDWIPWLSFLDLQGYVNKMKDLYKKLDKFHNYVIDDHLGRKKADKDHFVPKDVVDVLLQLADDPNLEVKLTRDCIKGLFQNLLVGGTDTSATTVEWTIHELIKQPRIIQKAKEELNRVIGRNRWVEENDFSQLPYIEAIIKESFRLHPLATFLAPHYAIEDCNVAGYDISKGTTILVNTWSIGRDPNSWSEPEKFLPERFLGKEIDILGSNFALLPFGSGRRRCPGYKLGLKVVRTMLANLLHGFDWKLVEGMKVEDVCLEEEYGLTTHPKVPLQIIMEPTLPNHLY
ncbi:hypothetical protein RD792_000666 [Penstemon davidsonii]|uniref:GST N-terminal domain-containing protein n=1 Tax=Penstemon davidsonii TaxID=160366 RepID=A0ABR0DLI4_9LAMI|nr:hypothetical protein RD792_000666 [Penstemon davidsonii]